MKTINENQFTFYSYTNYYGAKMYAIGHMDAMPVNYDVILFTGTSKDCKTLYEGMNHKFKVGQQVTAKEYKCGIAIIKEDTPFTYEEIIITKVIEPKLPLNKYSEVRYNYESVERLSELRDVPKFSGNIGQELLSSYIINYCEYAEDNVPMEYLEAAKKLNFKIA